MGHCPNCGKGKLFNGFLQIVNVCSNCKAKLGDLPTRDTPTQTAMFIVLAIFVPIVLAIEIVYNPSVWFHVWFSAPLLFILTLALLRIAKGAIAGILWVLKLKD